MLFLKYFFYLIISDLNVTDRVLLILKYISWIYSIFIVNHLIKYFDEKISLKNRAVNYVRIWQRVILIKA